MDPLPSSSNDTSLALASTGASFTGVTERARVWDADNSPSETEISKLKLPL